MSATGLFLYVLVIGQSNWLHKFSSKTVWYDPAMLKSANNHCRMSPELPDIKYYVFRTPRYVQRNFIFLFSG